MPKSSKRFVMSTSRVNAGGFRMLTEGADLSEFKQNPIMLWMHNRAWRGTEEEVLPLGYWEDIKIEGDSLTGVPFFDDKDEFAMKIYNKVENGTLRTCSIGAFPIELSDDPRNLLPGQTRPTVTKWKLKEVSITDIPSNADAVAVALYDQNEQLITLSSDSLNAIIPLLKPNSDMLKLTMDVGALAVKLGLSENASQAEFITAFDKVLGENVQLKATIEQQEKDAKEAKIIALVDKAEADRRITAGQKQQLITLARADFDSTKAYIESLPANPTVTSQINNGGAPADDAYTKLSWGELDKKGLLVKLKADNFEVFKAKYKDHFGTEYKGA